jgi:hypothetical protein
VVRTDATLDLDDYGHLTCNDATVVLNGPDSEFSNLVGLADNSGSFSPLNGRVFSTTGSLANSGELRLGEAARLNVAGDFTNGPSGTVYEDIADRPGSGLFGVVTWRAFEIPSILIDPLTALVLACRTSGKAGFRSRRPAP